MEIPDELLERMAQFRVQLPELLALSLHQAALPAATARAIVEFLASNPSPSKNGIAAGMR
jgi:hypothetical protein